MDRWKIEYYSTSSGSEPIQEFIDNLEETIKSHVYNTFELLAEFGPFLRMPHTKKIIGTPLWELRILGQSSLRFFYIAIVQKSFLILHGFKKKTQKTPKKEIDIALKRLKEYKLRT
ncbi:type II toxin-antitoxin system RelE/ParE family toxin [Candidatus Gottesmanbacteria bacterium]|nr:type II toxin-antitoxin system RelE/ParE family toxin [Candidatus Gottesmanbacteria bacterium]